MSEKILKSSMKDSFKEAKRYGKEIGKLIKLLKKKDRATPEYKKRVAEGEQLKKKWSDSIDRWYDSYQKLHKQEPVSGAPAKTSTKGKKKKSA